MEKIKTLTRNDLAESLISELGTRADAYAFVGKFFDVLSESIVAQGELKIHGFGTFRCLEKKKRVGRNPKTGKEAEISARRVVSFIAGNKFRKLIQQGVDEQS